MKRLLIIIFICFSAVTRALAEDGQVDSLLAEIRLAGKDQRKLSELYSDLAVKYLGIDVDKSKEYSRKAIDIAHRGGFNKELAKAFVSMGYANNQGGKADQAYLYADSAWRYAVKANYAEAKIHAQAIMGNVKRKKGLLDEALPHYLKAASLAEATGDKKLIGRAYNNLGVFYVSMRDLDRALSYHQKALGIRLEEGDASTIYQSYDNLGIIKRDMGKYREALEYYFKAEQYARMGNDSANLAYVYNDIGAAYSFSGDYENAEKYLKLAIAIRERIEEHNELAYTWNYLGENYERKKDLVNAEACIRKAIEVAKEIKSYKQTYEAYESFSDFFARNRKFDSAYRYALMHKHLRDSITRSNQAEIVAELNTKYETEKKERQISEQEYEISRRNYWLAGITGLLLLGSSVSYSGYRRYRMKQKAVLQAAVLRQQEMAVKAVISAEENERRRIANDLHDGVGQTMSAAKLNLSLLTTEIPFATPEQRIAFDKVVALVDDGCREVRSVSHNIMPNALLKNGFSSAIREFIDKIDQRIIQVSLYAEGLNERLDSNVETVLFRVVQECVNNVIKHSGANKLDITLIRDEASISITIEDNGRGFDLRKLTSSGYEGIGLKNIRSRIDYLKGSVDWDSSVGRGTVVVIEVPLKKNAEI